MAFQCDICSLVKTSRSSLSFHMRSAHTPKWVCPECKASIVSFAQSIRRHIQSCKGMMGVEAKDGIQGKKKGSKRKVRSSGKKSKTADVPKRVSNQESAPVSSKQTNLPIVEEIRLPVEEGSASVEKVRPCSDLGNALSPSIIRAIDGAVNAAVTIAIKHAIQDHLPEILQNFTLVPSGKVESAPVVRQELASPMKSEECSHIGTMMTKPKVKSLFSIDPKDCKNDSKRMEFSGSNRMAFTPRWKSKRTRAECTYPTGNYDSFAKESNGTDWNLECSSDEGF